VLTCISRGSADEKTKAALTKTDVDSLLSKISPACKAQMEAALDTQEELQSQCKAEIQEALLQLPGVDPHEGTVNHSGIDMKKPPGYDPNLKPQLPPAPPKLERDMRRAQRDRKQVEENKLSFATKVFLFLVIGALMGYKVFGSGIKIENTANKNKSNSNGSTKSDKVNGAKSTEDWMDDDTPKNKNKKKDNNKKKKP